MWNVLITRITATICGAIIVLVAATDEECAANSPCKPNAPYIWPMARGPVGSHSTSPHTAPRDIATKLAWTWRPETDSVSSGSLLMDDKKNLYAHWGPGFRKFSPDGRLLWTAKQDTWLNDVAAIMDGLLYSTSIQGFVFAIDMETGYEVWRTSSVCQWKSKILSKGNCAAIGADIGAVGANRGIIVVKTWEAPGGGSHRAAALNASNGEFLWDYASEQMIWNFYPIFTDDGDSFLFQDSQGDAYRLNLADGREIWMVSQHETPGETWTDGGVATGPNGVVYVMKSFVPNYLQSYPYDRRESRGKIMAYRIADGKHLWDSPLTPEVPNAWPVVGRMRDGDPLTVMAPSGPAGPGFAHYIVYGRLQNFLGPFVAGQIVKFLLYLEFFIGDQNSQWIWWNRDWQSEVWGMDADTGRVRWKWAPPPFKQQGFRGDIARIRRGSVPCIPNPVGNPSMDAAGTFFLGNMDGWIYALAPDGDGVKVASKFDTGMAFSNGGVVLGPGIMAIINCEAIFVFRE